MMNTGSNFAFLHKSAPQLARLGALAERYFIDDAPAALIKLRSLAEFMAKDVAARHGILSKVAATFDDILRDLRVQGVLPQQASEIFYHLKRVGNAAAHEDGGSTGETLNALKIAREAAIWFHRTYNGAASFKAGPLVPSRSVLEFGDASWGGLMVARQAASATGW